MENQTEQKLSGFMELMGKALDLCTRKFRVMAYIMLVPAILNFIIVLSQANFSQKSGGVGWYANIMFVTLLFAGIISILVTAWAYLATILVAKDNGLGFSEAYALSKNKLPSYILINILIAVATFPGVILLGIPAVIYLVWFSFSAFVMVTENHYGSNALMRSREYVTGRWWPVAWRILLLIILLFAIQFIVSMISQVVGFLIPASAKILAVIIQGVISSLTIILTAPLSISYAYIFYLNLRETRPELAKQPVNEKYKWLYILSPTTILVIVIFLIGIIFQFARGI